MGTTLKIQSKTIDSEKKSIYIQAQLYYEENAEVKELRAYILEQLPHGRDESYYISTLAQLLTLTGDYKRLEQVLKLGMLDNGGDLDKFYRSLIRSQNSVQNLKHDGGAMLYLADTFSSTANLLRDLEKRLTPSDSLRCSITALNEVIANWSSILSVSDNTSDLSELLHGRMPTISSLEQIISSLAIPPSHPLVIQIQIIKRALEGFQGKHKEALEHFETGQASSVFSLLNNHGHMSAAIDALHLSSSALIDDERSLKILENINNSTRPQANIFRQLAEYHERREDLPMAIAYYRSIIEECNLSSNSIEIVEAYHSIGSAFVNLEDIKSALWNYQRARDLLLQHHPPTHHLLMSVENLILILKAKQRLEQLCERLSKHCQ